MNLYHWKASCLVRAESRTTIYGFKSDKHERRNPTAVTDLREDPKKHRNSDGKVPRTKRPKLIRRDIGQFELAVGH